MKLPIAILFAGALSLSHVALAEKVWDPNGNVAINNWISGMYSGISGPLNTLLQNCQVAVAANCTVTILANGGIHASASDASQHFTVRFAGTNHQYNACHIYPQNPNAIGDKALRGANCYDANHQATYYKLN